MSVSRNTTLAAVFAVAIASACGRGNERPPSSPPSTTGAGGGSNESAIESLAMARCDREELCNNVGTGKTYANREACLDELRNKGRDELRTSECPRGIDPTQLDKCLAEIRGERCGNPLDKVGRLNACRSDGLCLK